MTYLQAAGRACLVAFAVALAMQTARATTIIPVSDDDLVASSLAIVEGRCVDIRTAWNDDRTLIYSFVTFKVRRVLKGDVQPGRITIREPGGTVGDTTAIIWGAPYWQTGWDMLLYLNTDSTGAYRVAHLSLGYFRIMTNASTGVRYVSRPDFGGHVVVVGGGSIASTEPYDQHIARIEALTGEAPRDVDPDPAYEAESAAKSGDGTADFRFLSPGFRWFEPDTGDVIRYKVNPDMAPTPSGGMEEARASLDAWSTVPGSSLRAEVAGTTTACGLRADGVNAISFNDCTGMFDPPINCSGVVAVGGVAAATPSQSATIGGRTFARIQDADVTFNPGFECLLTDSLIVSELMTHEVGHTLGFGHSSEDLGESNPLLRDATMFFLAHLDRRGAVLREDDQDAVRFLYRSSVTPRPLAIVTEALPDARLNAPYSVALEATGSGPFTWSLVSGSLPRGITLASNGTLAGTPDTAEEATFTVRVRDVANFEMQRTLWLRATATPAPFVTSVAFKASKSRLTVTAVNVDASAQLVINGTPIAPPLTVKFKPARSTLIVNGAAADLNVRASAPKNVVVKKNGQTSNAFNF